MIEDPETLREKYHDVGNKHNRIRVAAEMIKRLAQSLKVPKGDEDSVTNIIKKCDLIEDAVLQADRESVNIKNIVYRSLDPDQSLEIVLKRIKEKNKNIRLFIVEDDVEVCEMMKVLYGKRGMTVDGAFGAKEAIEKIKNFNPDVVLLDLYLPEMGAGKEVLFYIKQHLPQAFCLVVTKEDEKKILDEIIRMGADEVLQKPLSLGEIDVKINGLISKLEK
jgi:CheY-like chemotaxis protein